LLAAATLLTLGVALSAGRVGADDGVARAGAARTGPAHATGLTPIE
jgi:hypothetical protein